MDHSVVAETYTNLGNEALDRTPVTFSRVGAPGDFAEGITPVFEGRALPAQVDVLARNGDDSIRHALVSFFLPGAAAGASFEVDYTDTPPQEPAPFEWVRPDEASELVFELVGAGGSTWTTRLSLDAGAPGNHIEGGLFAGEPRELIAGPVMREVEVRDIPVDGDGFPHPTLDVIWRLREFSGESSMRVALIVETSRLGTDHPRARLRFESLRLTHGDRELIARGAFEQLDRTRYRLLVWTGEPLETIHRRPNVEYLERGRFIPPYRPEGRPESQPGSPAVDLAAAEKKYVSGRRFGPLLPGVIHPHMPGTGDRPDIGPYPGWALAYLYSGSPQLYRVLLHADGNGSGSFPIHLRSAPDAAGVNYHNDRRAVEARKKLRLPNRNETESKVAPDQAHAPSLGYLAYLITGDRFYGEELSFWASYQLAQWPWVGINLGAPERTQAWGLRHVVDAAFLLPDDDPLKSYLVDEVDAYTGKIAELAESGAHGLNYLRQQFRISGRPHWVNCKRTSPWQYAWIVWSLGNAADKGFESAELPRDWTAEYIVGLYTSDDEFEAPDGKTYRFDPVDAMQSNLATAVFEYTTRERNGQAQTELGRKLREIDNYGEVWYWTKVNCDNGYNDREGFRGGPDSRGAWPLDDPGWGHGLYASGKRAYNWNRYGAWVGLVSAVNGEVESAPEAWELMNQLAGPGSQHGFNMQPRGLAGPARTND